MKLFKFSITLLFSACLLLLAGCMHEKDLSASGSIPAEQTEYEAKEVSITTLEQAKEYFPDLWAPDYADDELVSVEYTPLTGKLLDGYDQETFWWLPITEARPACEGEPVKQLDITYTLKDGSVVRVNVQQHGATRLPDNVVDRVSFQINDKSVTLYGGTMALIGGTDCFYRFTVDGVSDMRTLYEYVSRHIKRIPNFYDSHPDWLPVGEKGIPTRERYYFVGDMSNIETNAGYSLQIPDAVQDKIIVFGDEAGNLDLYLKARYGQEPVINQEFDYCWPGYRHSIKGCPDEDQPAPFASIQVTDQYNPDELELYHPLATDGEHVYSCWTAADLLRTADEYDDYHRVYTRFYEITPEQYYPPIDALGITEDTLLDMMVFDNPDHVTRAMEPPLAETDNE